MTDFAFPQFDESIALPDGRAWTARFESWDQRNDDVYYTIRIAGGATFIGRVGYTGESQDEEAIRADFQAWLARIAEAGVTNTSYAGSSFGAR